MACVENTVLEAILSLLSGCDLTHYHHDEALNAEQAAAARGTPLSMGGKSLLMKLDGIGMAVVAIPGDARLSGALLRRGLGVARYRFARPEELAATLGLPPGAVPPFGRPVFPLPLFVDARLAAGPQLVFALGSRRRSARVATADYLARAQPDRVVPLSEALPERGGAA